MILIAPPPIDGNKAQSAIGTTFFTESGEEITGVISAKVTFSAEEIVTAEITVSAHMNEVWALPFMSEESFLAAAKRYGYEVTKKGTDNAHTQEHD